MTRDDLRGIVEGITDEQLKQILDIHSRGIGKAKGEVEELKLKLSKAEEGLAAGVDTAKLLEESQCEAEKLKVRIEELQKVIDQNEADAASAKSRKEQEDRFECAAGDARFINDFTKSGLLAEFLEAVADEKNAGRADGEIFEELAKGRDNLFMPKDDVPSVISSTMGFGGQITDGDVREIMGLPPQI